MGKTSFILSVLQQTPEWGNNVCNLCIVDPTMIETKEHIFLNIIALINERVNEYRDQINDGCYQDWKKALSKLAGGLNVLDGVGSEQLKQDLWDSPELILEKGLSNSKQGAKLELYFHDFLKESLRLLNKKVFLLILDDIDTSITEGKAILETLRKYLTSKQLIIIMLGDIDLYTTIVRQLQWEKMDPNETLYKYESSHNTGEKCKQVNEFYRSQIEHLEEQYLTKILKPENRITLKTIAELKDNVKIESSTESKTDPEPLSTFLRTKIDSFYYTERQIQYTELYEKTLLTQSIRSVVQVLKGWDNLIPTPAHTAADACVEVLQQVFFTTLKKKLEPFDLLYSKKNTSLFYRLFTYMIKNGITCDSHMKLLPEYNDDETNLTMLFLNAQINAQLSPKEYLSYLIRVAYALDRFASTDHPDNRKEKFIPHVGLDSDISNQHIAARLLTTHKIKYNSPIFFGNFYLTKDHFKKLETTENLALFMSRVLSRRQDASYTMLSLFNLLGILSDISENPKPKNSKDATPTDFLKDSDPIRDFYSYFDDPADASSDDASAKETRSFDITEPFKNDLYKWSENVHKINQYLSAADLANIWIRFSYSLKGIDNESENKTKTYTEWYELYRAALLNSVYICCEQKKGETPNLKNPVSDTEFFKDKINQEKYSTNNHTYTLFDYLNSCPAFEDKENNNDKLFNIPLSIPIPKKSTTSPKKKFSDLTEELQIKTIRNIPKWETKNAKEIKKELSTMGYTYAMETTIQKRLNQIV
ncbi:hypothetical protein [Prosthecochloris vibrioformis]|uniref:KAP NTPase domain-containing protein n=1 Tax=Prosthecochloris vibrioformis TaxID=1098 RepID=A0A5C4RRU4_PROVB|nr:hypothetical protein [Prosthecochloris vibrioformis]TNJ34053.1 hypothetical protein FGF68_10570 [Prosthecochloris vibrioformis]